MLLATHAAVQERAVVRAVRVLLTYIKVRVVQHVLLDTILISQTTRAIVSCPRLFIHRNFYSNFSKVVSQIATHVLGLPLTSVPHAFLETFYIKGHVQLSVLRRDTIQTPQTTFVKVSFCRFFKHSN